MAFCCIPGRKAAQAGVELIILVAFFLVLILIFAVVSSGVLSHVIIGGNYNEAYRGVQSLASAADSVFAQGEGASQSVQISIPANTDFNSSRTYVGRPPGSSASPNTVSIRVGRNDAFAISRAELVGSLPQIPGDYVMYVTSHGSYVSIGTAFVDITPSSPRFSVHQGSSSSLPLTVSIGSNESQKVRVSLSPPDGEGSPRVFDYTGADQYFTVPDGVTTVDVKMWGAGGAGSPSSGTGGGGGYTSATLTVTPGETLTVMVGQGGPTGIYPTTYGGGGTSPGYGSGGGRSEVDKLDGSFIIAGGGGAGGDYYPFWTCGGPYFNGYGGAGGGASGQDGGDITSGHGGANGVGGAGGFGYYCASPSQSGDSRNGGSDCGGGGGGGYGGGGSGNVMACKAGGGGGGGGGCDGSSVSNCYTEAGADVAPANSGDSDRGSAGNGGAANSDGNPGRVIISYVAPSTGSPDTGNVAFSVSPELFIAHGQSSTPVMLFAVANGNAYGSYHTLLYVTSYDATTGTETSYMYLPIDLEVIK
jgi:hypothetical protein